MTFRVGQRVGCINDVFWSITKPGQPRTPYGPRLHRTYIVKDLGTYLGLNYIELESFAPIEGGRRRWWAAENFRPIPERRTSIDIFTALLTPKPLRQVEAPGQTQ